MRFALVAALVAVASPAVSQSANAGGWTLISVGGIAAEPGGRIAFSSDGAVFGSTGCNRFQAKAVSAPGVLTFSGPLATTKMGCSDPLAEQESQMLSALEGSVAVAYDPVAERMMLIPQEGAPVLGFKRTE